MKTALLTWSLVSFTAALTIVVIALVVTLSPNTGGATDYRSLIIDNINKNYIENFLRNLTKYPHPAGSDRSHEIAKIIAEKWKDHGLQDVKILPYNVFLSQADPNNTNYFQIMDSSGEQLHKSSADQPPVDEFPQEDQDKILSFNAFSGNGVVENATVVYANYGTEEDYKYLEGQGTFVNETIVLVRYGKIFRGDKIRFAAKREALGVILYTDPADAAPLGRSADATYPDTIYAPGGGVQLGSLVLQGDLLTPGYPATDDAFRISKGDAEMPKIPVQPVGYDDAYQIFTRLGGEPVTKPEWRGGLNVTYKYGGKMMMNGTTIKLSVSNINALKNIYNVIGSLTGLEEPDRYVLLGNHHDAWGYGGIDPSSATANMLELSRVFGGMYKDGWRPRRTLVFCSWDAEESGIIGSTEYAEQFSAALKDQAVVYLNVDMVMFGNYSFSAAGLPHLSDIIRNVSQEVPNPDCQEFDAGRKYLYDTWVDRFPDGGEDPRPVIDPLGTGSDYRAYVYNLGIPSLDLYFMQAPNETDLPLYHMAYETFELATKLMDKGLYFHEASARMWGVLAYEFSARYALPINVVKLSQFVQSSLDDFKTTYKEKLNHLNVTMDTVDAAAKIFSSATQQFWQNIQKADLNDELTLRRYNDAMMLMDRSFLSPQGLPLRKNLNHVLVAPNMLNQYVWETFPGLHDYMRDEGEAGYDPTRKGFLQHMASIAYHLNMAANALTFTLW